MFKRFLNGLAYGTGFGIAFLVILYLGVNFFILPKVFESQVYEVSSSSNESRKSEVAITHSNKKTGEQLKLPFHELGLDDQIRHSSVIVLAEFQPESNGKVNAIISDILKKG